MEIFRFMQDTQPADSYWLANVQNGSFPIRMSDITNQQQTELGQRIADAMGIDLIPASRAGLRGSGKRVFRQLLKPLPVDKVHAQCYGGMPWEEINFRIYGLGRLLGYFCTQLKDVRERDGATTQERYPLPLYTRSFDPYSPPIRRRHRLTALDSYCLKSYVALLDAKRLPIPDTMAAALENQTAFTNMADNGPMGSPIDVESPGFAE